MRVKFLEDSENYVVFFPDSLKIFKVNAFTKNVIEDMCKGMDYEALAEKYMISDSVCRKIKSFVTNGNKYDPVVSDREKDFNNLSEEQQQKIRDRSKNMLNKLTLHVTNTCNLACKYCYADGGCYHSESGFMSYETAKKAVDFFYSRYSYIDNVMFFGGEPLMNIELIDKICEYIATFIDEDNLPRYGLVTNGVLVDDHVIEILNKHKIYVTVSIDGDVDVNDKTRVFRDGRGTGEIIKKNIALLKEKTELCTGIEITYNANHVNSGLGVMDLLHFGMDTLKIGHVHIVPVSVDIESDLYVDSLDTFIEAIDIGFEENIFVDYTKDLIQRLTYKIKNRNICAAGIGSLSVSSTGDIFPCFMLNNVEQFKMGNINGELGEQFKKVRNELANHEVDKTEDCKDCFMNQFCKGCLGSNYFATNDVFKMSKQMCEMNKKMAERIIVNIANNDERKNSEKNNNS